MTLIKSLLWLFLINISCKFIYGQTIENDPCSRKPCLPDEICVKQTVSSFLCVKRSVLLASQQKQPETVQNTFINAPQPVQNNDEDLQILNNIANFDGPKVTNNQQPVFAPRPVQTQPASNEDSDILKGLFQNPIPVPSSPHTVPLVPTGPLDKTILSNNIGNQLTNKILPISKSEASEDDDARILETILGKPASAARPEVIEQNIPGIQNTIIVTTKPLPLAPIAQKIAPGQFRDVLPTNNQNLPKSSVEDQDSQILEALLNDPLATTTKKPVIPTVNQLQNTDQTPVQPVQPVLPQGSIIDTDAQIIQNILNNQIPFTTKAPAIVPVISNVGTKSNIKPKSNDLNESDLQIIQSLLNSNPVTTTTRLPPWKVGIRPSQAGNVRTDMNLIMALRNKYRKPVNSTQASLVPTVSPNHRVDVPIATLNQNSKPENKTENVVLVNPELPPSVQPTQLPLAGQDTNGQIPTINQQTPKFFEVSGEQTNQNSASKLREQLRAKSGIPVTQPQPKNNEPNNIAIDNIIQKLVEEADTTTTTTTTTPKPIKKEPYCLGYRTGDQLPHPTERKKFIVCQFNDYVIMSCPATLVYNRYLNRCDRNDNEPPKACLSTPCRNGGKCFDTETYGFVCECAQGFSGTTCEKGIDPCFSNPCSPNGSCNSLENFKVKSIGYYCLCYGGNSYGLNCDNKPFANPCLEYHNGDVFYPSALSPSLFIHCESDIMNIKSCTEPLVWSQNYKTCVKQEDLEAEEEEFEFVDETHQQPH